MGTSAAIVHEKTGLLVVGCGPTGVAALVQASLEGIPAIGIEAGPAPLASVLSYMEGLVLTSPAFHYEVGELPLDCRAVNHVTREDVLHYYARVITQHRLDIRCDTQCVRLEPRKGSVAVRVRTARGLGVYRAERVLVTSWHERRPIDPAMLTAEPRFPIYSTIRNPIQLAGKKVIILGGGLSAHEVATRLMLNGQRVLLLARCEPTLFSEHPQFQALLSATGSTVRYRVSNVTLHRSEIEFTQDGQASSAPCEALVAAIGHRLRQDILALLLKAGVLAEHEAERLRSAKSYEKLRRESPQEDEASLKRRAAAEVPDLREQVFAGRQGIHLAGGALHVGAANAGIMYSIFSAVLAVKSIAGHPLPRGAEAPLPEYFSALSLPENVEKVAFERIASLHPLRASARARTEAPPGIEEDALGHLVRRGDPGSSTRSMHLIDTDPEIQRILEAADGTCSVADLAARFQMRSPKERLLFGNVLRSLWWNDALTWLPAG